MYEKVKKIHIKIFFILEFFKILNLKSFLEIISFLTNRLFLCIHITYVYIIRTLLKLKEINLI